MSKKVNARRFLIEGYYDNENKHFTNSLKSNDNFNQDKNKRVIADSNSFLQIIDLQKRITDEK